MEENVFEIQKKAENGDAYYQHEMGVNYQYGYGVPVDKQKSMEWFQKAADNGNSESMRALGIIYECGLGVDKDPGKAFDFFQKSVEAGNTKSLEKLAWFFEEGVVVEKNEGKAKELYERFFTELQKQAIDGDADAMYRMGDIYQYGFPQLGIPVYYQQAAEWYERAANKGYMVAQTSLGILYYLGLGVPKNYTKAAEWYKKAAEQGDASAMYNLAGCYMLGRGVKQNDELAAKYNQKAANMDMSEAQAELAGMYYRGWGVEQDYTMAVHWFKRAIANGYENAYDIDILHEPFKQEREEFREKIHEIPDDKFVPYRHKNGEEDNDSKEKRTKKKLDMPLSNMKMNKSHFGIIHLMRKSYHIMPRHTFCWAHCTMQEKVQAE